MGWSKCALGSTACKGGRQASRWHCPGRKYTCRSKSTSNQTKKFECKPCGECITRSHPATTCYLSALQNPQRQSSRQLPRWGGPACSATHTLARPALARWLAQKKRDNSTFALYHQNWISAPRSSPLPALPSPGGASSCSVTLENPGGGCAAQAGGAGGEQPGTPWDGATPECS